MVIIPTYNEVENLPIIAERVRSATPQVDILVVDDNSPDGTGDKADELAAADEHIHVLHRKVKDGLLGAYLAGFEYGLENGYQVLCQMDADGSHAPEQLHLLLDEIDRGADLVIGSRYVRGGKAVNWPRERYLLSKMGNLYISLALGGDIKDMTAGYRAFRREVLEAIDLDSLSRKGYIFQVQLADAAINEAFDVREVPITFVDRELGESKLDASFAKDSLIEVTKWGADRRTTQIADFSRELARLGKYQVKELGIPKIPGKIKYAEKSLRAFTREMGKLGAYEVQRLSHSTKKAHK
nr:polyprenol monophosphomannose synthase [Corynebacterium aquatimens]